MVRPVSLLSGFALLTLACMPVVYPIPTLIGMRRKELYPLLRIRLADGSHRSVTKTDTSLGHWGIGRMMAGGN
jgi:hypothetical protein